MTKSEMESGNNATTAKEGSGCECMGDKECVHCSGNGTITYIKQEGWIYDAEHGWITDPDGPPPTEKKVTEECHMCKGSGKCRICT